MKYKYFNSFSYLINNNFTQFLKVDTQAIFIPEEDRWISILELNENDKFLEFYHSMLQLYEAVCAQSNNYVAHQVCKLIDERQLMYCIQNQCNNNKNDIIKYINSNFSLKMI